MAKRRARSIQPAILATQYGVTIQNCIIIGPLSDRQMALVKRTMRTLLPKAKEVELHGAKR